MFLVIGKVFVQSMSGEWGLVLSLSRSIVELASRTGLSNL